MGVRPHLHAVAAGRHHHRSEMVEEDERTDHPALHAGQHAAHREARSQLVGAALDEKLYRISHLILPLRLCCNGAVSDARDLSPFFAPRSIAVAGAGERAPSSGGAIMQLLRQAGYGGRVVLVNPKRGTIFGYEAVTSIAATDPPVDLAVIVIAPRRHPRRRLADAREDRFALAFEAAMDDYVRAHDMVIMIYVVSSWSTLRPSLPGKAEWFATMERAERSDVQRCRGNGGSGRAAGALSGASRFPRAATLSVL